MTDTELDSALPWKKILSQARRLENMAASPPHQVWFDTEVLEALESDNLDVVATTGQHSKTAFRSDVQIEPPEEVPGSS